MAPEQRSLLGVKWKNERIGIDKWHTYCLNHHFFDDDKAVRICLEWVGANLHGRLGWLVGLTSAVTVHDGTPIGADRDIVIFDGDETCTNLAKCRIKENEYDK